MATFEFVGKDVLIDGVSTSQVAQTLKSAGIRERSIGEILGHWYWGATGTTKPAPFDFATDVQDHDPACEITYERTFEHVDWVDGEDRVQASATPEELGFNARFHAIENELDAIAEQFRGVGRCARDIRADLVGVVRELESKITALQNELHELREAGKQTRPGPGMGVIGSVKVGDKEAFITSVGNDFRLVEFAGDIIGTKVDPRVKPGLVVEEVYDPRTVRPEDLVGLYEGLEEVVLLPEVRDLVERGGGATIGELRRLAGGTTLPGGGPTLASVIADMPADTQLEGVAGTIDAITGHVAAGLPEETAKAALATVLVEDSLRGASAEDLGGAKATSVGVTVATAAVLAAAGMQDTIAGLAGTTSVALLDKVTAAGGQVSVTEARGAVARARLAAKVAGVLR